MAQLPPKIPNMATNWPEFSRQKIPSIGNFAPTTTTAVAFTHQNPSWVDEFLDFSSARRGSHRRSVSDSITFLEMPMLEEDCRGSTAPPPPPGSGSGDRNEFDGFEDEQFLSMFNDEISAGVAPTVSSSNPSTPSDHNSINDEKDAQNDGKQNQNKNETDEVQSQQQSDTQTHSNSTATATSTERITDPKRVKRILANRQSAQRSRVRKLQYISELERSVTSLQAEVSVLSPRVAFLDHQRLLLNVDNSALKQRIAALAQDKIFKDAHQEALKREIERLRQVYHQQNMKKTENAAPHITASVAVTATTATDGKLCNVGQKEQAPNVVV
ncbi:basic leucine zipper 61-like isoform X1 [Cucurbita moschata]|uniref:Basic leucine zipper 61-like isoform X1 n=1 Tax=Cucurbita moschata TaxID=3662 RepID=A0A6J1GKA0_CUCMO|nr:basic leucine zipper 61-like isoform X1 [Cucurbita moschata]